MEKGQNGPGRKEVIQMEQGILLAVLAGMGGTGLGGLAAVLWGKKSLSIQGLLYFTAGIMLGMAFFDLLPEAVAHGTLWTVALGLVGGGLLVWAAEKAESRREGEKQGRMVSAGLMMLAALMLHNLPEGFVIGAAAGAHAWERAGLIALHNVPGGMAMAFPLLQGGFARGKVFLLSVVCGLPLVAGSVLGTLAGAMPEGLLSLCLSLAAGSMVFAAGFEMSQMEQKQGKLWFLWLLLGLALAFALSVGHAHAH